MKNIITLYLDNCNWRYENEYYFYIITCISNHPFTIYGKYTKLNVIIPFEKILVNII